MRFDWNNNQMAVPFPMMPGGMDFSQVAQMAQQPIRQPGVMRQPNQPMMPPNQPMQTQFGPMQTPANTPAPGTPMRQPNTPMLPPNQPMQSNFGNMQMTKPYTAPGGPVTGMLTNGVSGNGAMIQQQQMLGDPSRPYGTAGPMGMLTPQRMDMQALMRNPAEIQRRNQYYSGL